MKTFEKRSTNENLFLSMQEDSIKRNNDLFYFVDLLNLLDGNYSIALDGPWGSGKTFFVKQAKMIFDAHNDWVDSTFVKENKDEIRRVWSKINKTASHSKQIEFEPQVAVYYDAWKNDSDEDPVISIVYSIIQQLNEIKELSLPQKFIKVVSAIVDTFTHTDSSKIIDALQNINGLFEIIQKRDLESQIDEFFESIPVEKGNRIIIFIDELDRCNPEYAVKLLERIKHYFTNDRITFVFSTNISELEHTIKMHYGDYFDASRYLDRFFDLRLALQPVNLDDFFFSINFTRQYYTDGLCISFIKKNEMQMREICKYLLMVKTVTQKYIDTPNRKDFTYYDGDYFMVYVILPIIMGLKIINTQRYNDFISGKDPSPLLELIDQIYEFGIVKLLNQQETFEEQDKTKKYVTLEEKLNELYLLIFAHNDNKDGCLPFGEYKFRADSKEWILQFSGMLSGHSDFTINDDEGDQEHE